MSQSETEHDRRVREYWANAYEGSGSGKSPVYDIGSLDFTKNNDDDNDRLPFEPARMNTRKRISVYDILGLDLRRED